MLVLQPELIALVTLLPRSSCMFFEAVREGGDPETETVWCLSHMLLRAGHSART